MANFKKEKNGITQIVKKPLRVGIDVDDVLMVCNEWAIELLNLETGLDMSVNDIKSWGYTGTPIDGRLKYFEDPSFVSNQPLFPGARDFVKKLSKKAEVFFVTAVGPACMTARAQRLVEEFPEIPSENIIMGRRKDLLSIDVLLDDSVSNIVNSTVTYPVLMRRPWNSKLSGLLMVNNYDDFLHLIDQISDSLRNEPRTLEDGGILCLIGPTGSGKNEIANILAADKRFERPLVLTTNPNTDSPYKCIDESIFGKTDFIESTTYSGFQYGTTVDAINSIVEKKRVAVMPIDICGAIAVRNRYKNNTLFFFIERDKESILSEIISRNFSVNEKVRRIMSLDYEFNNAELCDYMVNNTNPEVTAAKISAVI